MFIGNEKQKNLIDEMLKKESMSHHAFLFVGPEFIGKFSIAFQLAQALVLGQKKIDWQNENQKVSGDITIIEPLQEENKGIVKQKDISISQVREAVKFFHLSADGNAKVIIIKNAHKMTTEAQNALLKTLEEPPKKAFLILVTSEISSILDTISSRCFKIFFNLVENESLKVLTQDKNLIDNAMGRPEFLKKMLENSEFNDWVNFSVEKLRNLAKMSVSEKIDLAEFLSKKSRLDLDIFLQIWIFRIRKVALEQKKFKLLKVASKVENVFREIHFSNVNLRLILEEMFLSMS